MSSRPTLSQPIWDFPEKQRFTLHTPYAAGGKPAWSESMELCNYGAMLWLMGSAFYSLTILNQLCFEPTFQYVLLQHAHSLPQGQVKKSLSLTSSPLLSSLTSRLPPRGSFWTLLLLPRHCSLWRMRLGPCCAELGGSQSTLPPLHGLDRAPSPNVYPKSSCPTATADNPLLTCLWRIVADQMPPTWGLPQTRRQWWTGSYSTWGRSPGTATETEGKELRQKQHQTHNPAVQGLSYVPGINPGVWKLSRVFTVGWGSCPTLPTY